MRLPIWLSVVITFGGTKKIRESKYRLKQENIIKKGICPSGKCWINDDGICRLKSKTNCVQLYCHADKLVIQFKNKLLGLTSSSKVASNQTDDQCLPKWEENQWKWVVSLGTCGMRVTKDKQNGYDIVYLYKFHFKHNFI